MKTQCSSGSLWDAALWDWRSLCWLIPGALFFLPGILTAQQQSHIDSLEASIPFAQDNECKVRDLNTLARYYTKRYQFEKARTCADSALALAVRVNFFQGQSVANRHIGMLFFEQSKYAEALKYLTLALQIDQDRHAGKGWLADDYENIATVYSMQGQLQKALQMDLAVLEMQKEYGKKRPHAITLYNVGQLYTRLGDFTQAMKYLNASLADQEEARDTFNMIATIRCMGDIYGQMGNYPEALKHYYTALRFSETQPGKEDQANIYLNMGTIYADQNKYTEAEKYYLESMKVAEETGNLKTVAMLYIALANVKKEQGDYDKALDNLKLSLHQMTDIGSEEGITYADLNLGDLYERLGNLNEALNYYNQGLKLSQEMDADVLSCGASILVGNIHSKLGNFIAARKYLNDGLSLARTLGYKHELAEGYQDLAALDSIEGNYQLALDDYKMYVLYQDSLVNEKSNQQSALIKIQYETEKKDREIELLNKNNEIKALQLSQQEALLHTSRLETEKNINAVTLLNDSFEIQQLTLARTQQYLDQQKAETKVKETEMEMLRSKEILKEQQLGRQAIIRNSIVAGALLIIAVGLLLFRGLQLQKKVEKQQAVIRERHRISADLHDDIGSGLARISLLSELVKNEARTPEARNEVSKIASISRELLESIREIIWALNTNNDYLENLAAYIRRYAAEYFENSPVTVRIDIPGHIPHLPVSGEARRNIFYAVKEALHNIMKHARATEAEITMRVTGKGISVDIHDNGHGFDMADVSRFGNGLKNMVSRMHRIHGGCDIASQNGTNIRLTLPVG